MAILDDLARLWALNGDDLHRVASRFPFRISPHMRSLMGTPGDPIWRQAMPDIAEIEDTGGLEDPLAEESLSPVPHVVHRYSNRVLWLVGHECAMNCRFCTRKRRWKHSAPLSEAAFDAGIEYIRAHREIQDVLLSGGDPLLLSTARLESILASLRRIPHVQIIRIGTRVPGALPGRVTPELARALSRHHPLYMNLHFNHPIEINPKSRQACATLADAGIPLGSQTVLLRGINDDPEVLGNLLQELLTMRVRPYYLMQMDLTQGTAHFRTPLATGLRLLRALRNHLSGMAIPHFVVDLPGGRGKVPLVPGSIEEIAPHRLVMRDYKGHLAEYPLLPGESEDLGEWLTHSVSPGP